MKDKQSSKILEPITFSPFQAVRCHFCLNQGIAADQAIAFMRLDSHSSTKHYVDVMCENGHGFSTHKSNLVKIERLKGKG